MLGVIMSCTRVISLSSHSYLAVWVDANSVFGCAPLTWFCSTNWVPLIHQRLKSLSQEVREFVATESAQVVPISAKTGHGLDHLRQAVAASLLSGDDAYENPEAGRSETVKSEVAGSSQPPSRSVSLTIRSETADSAAEVKAPVGAATATVLDYVSSAKSGKVMVSEKIGRMYFSEEGDGGGGG